MECSYTDVFRNFIYANLLLLAADIYFMNISKQNIPMRPPAHLVITKKSYSDPGNHFTVSVPSNWNSTSGYGNQTTGIGTAQEETTSLEDTNLSAGRVGLNFSVYEKTPYCKTAEKPDTTIAGMPAYFNPQHYSWIINTTDSTIVLGYYCFIS